MRRYMANVFRACSVDPHVVDTLWNVTNLLEPPSRLLRPAMVARVWRGARRARRENRPGTTPAALPVPAS